jgi:hypothetical protein
LLLVCFTEIIQLKKLDVGWGSGTLSPSFPLRHLNPQNHDSMGDGFRESTASPVRFNSTGGLLGYLRNINFDDVGEEEVAALGMLLNHHDIHHRVLEYLRREGIEGFDESPSAPTFDFQFTPPLESLHLVSTGSTRALSQLDDDDECPIQRISSAESTDHGIPSYKFSNAL